MGAGMDGIGTVYKEQEVQLGMVSEYEKEVAKRAAELGLNSRDPVSWGRFSWIAEEFYKAPLPEPWSAYADDHGQVSGPGRLDQRPMPAASGVEGRRPGRSRAQEGWLPSLPQKGEQRSPGQREIQSLARCFTAEVCGILTRRSSTMTTRQGRAFGPTRCCRHSATFTSSAR